MSQRRRAVLVMPDAELEASLQDATQSGDDHDIVAVLGNGAGWYAALGVAGVLSPDDAQRVVRELAALQHELQPAGGQVVYPLTDAAWRPEPSLRASMEAAFSADGDVRPIVDLGGFMVLAGSSAGVDVLMPKLRRVRIGNREYPVRLPGQGALHGPVMARVAEAARERLTGVAWRSPRITLIDGQGVSHSPWSADPLALRDYTLGEQLVTTYRFATALRVALREFAPDVLVVPGAGGTLATVCGQIVVAEGYRGIHSRRAFVDAQRQRPIVLSMRHAT